MVYRPEPDPNPALALAAADSIKLLLNNSHYKPVPNLGLRPRGCAAMDMLLNISHSNKGRGFIALFCSAFGLGLGPMALGHPVFQSPVRLHPQRKNISATGRLCLKPTPNISNNGQGRKLFRYLSKQNDGFGGFCGAFSGIFQGDLGVFEGRFMIWFHNEFWVK